MLWLKAFHIIFMTTWFAGLFYLPRLFVYHALTDDLAGKQRFKVMERKLFYAIMTPGGVLTVGSGLWLLSLNWEIYLSQMWIAIKLLLVALLLIYHIVCAFLVQDFKHDRNRRSHVWYRFFNEVPVIFLVAIVLLAVVRPA